MIRMLLSGVNHIHANGIVHKGLKHANCLMDKDLNLRIIDFGSAFLKREQKYRQEKKEGARNFLAPEILRTGGSWEVYDAPVDIWACGIIMYELFAG